MATKQKKIKSIKDTSLELAIQQFIGFIHASKGYDICSLIEAMALTKTEWNKIKKDGIAKSLKTTDYKDINDYFNHPSSSR